MGRVHTMSNWQEQEDDEPQQQQQQQRDVDVSVGSEAPQIKLNELKES